MTKRAFFIILVFVSLLTTLGYLNDHVLRLESTSNGHQLPIIVIGLLFLFVLTINPMTVSATWWSRVCRRKAWTLASSSVRTSTLPVLPSV